jgi:DNA protecting protein DprA
MKDSVHLEQLVLSTFLSEVKFYSAENYFKAMRLLEFEVKAFSNEFLHFVPPLLAYKDRFRLRRDLIYQSLAVDLEKNRRLLTPLHPDYPKRLMELEELPLILRVEGFPVWRQREGLAVVGSREPRSQSTAWMEIHLQKFMRLSTCYISSGGARGIDQKAHLLAIETKTPTVVFLPSGLDKVYPANMTALKQEIIDQGGAFVSEYTSDLEIRKHHFVQRNRLISGISVATLIVEAQQKSGTMITAREAIDQHRPVWVLPGHPMDVAMAGNNELLLSGATPVINAQDLNCLFDSETLSKNLNQVYAPSI